MPKGKSANELPALMLRLKQLEPTEPTEMKTKRPEDKESDEDPFGLEEFLSEAKKRKANASKVGEDDAVQEEPAEEPEAPPTVEMEPVEEEPETQPTESDSEYDTTLADLPDGFGAAANAARQRLRNILDNGPENDYELSQQDLQLKDYFEEPVYSDGKKPDPFDPKVKALVIQPDLRREGKGTYELMARADALVDRLIEREYIDTQQGKSNKDGVVTTLLQRFRSYLKDGIPEGGKEEAPGSSTLGEELKQKEVSPPGSDEDSDDDEYIAKVAEQQERNAEMQKKEKAAPYAFEKEKAEPVLKGQERKAPIFIVNALKLQLEAAIKIRTKSAAEKERAWFAEARKRLRWDVPEEDIPKMLEKLADVTPEKKMKAVQSLRAASEALMQGEEAIKEKKQEASEAAKKWRLDNHKWIWESNKIMWLTELLKMVKELDHPKLGKQDRTSKEREDDQKALEKIRATLNSPDLWAAGSWYMILHKYDLRDMWFRIWSEVESIKMFNTLWELSPLYAVQDLADNVNPRPESDASTAQTPQQLYKLRLDYSVPLVYAADKKDALLGQFLIKQYERTLRDIQIFVGSTYGTRFIKEFYKKEETDAAGKTIKVNNGINLSAWNKHPETWYDTIDFLSDEAAVNGEAKFELAKRGGKEDNGWMSRIVILPSVIRAGLDVDKKIIWTVADPLHTLVLGKNYFPGQRAPTLTGQHSVITVLAEQIQWPEIVRGYVERSEKRGGPILTVPIEVRGTDTLVKSAPHAMTRDAPDTLPMQIYPPANAEPDRPPPTFLDVPGRVAEIDRS